MTARHVLAVAAALLLSAAPGFTRQPLAQPQFAQQPLRSGPIVQTPLPEPTFFEEQTDTVFSVIRSGFRYALGSLSGFVTPPLALDVAKRTRSEDPYDFISMMEVAGYKLKEVESTVSLIPSVNFTFGIARELSDADREWLALQLERHAKRRWGIFASAERAIIQTLLDAQELGGYQVEKLDIDVFPWPRIKFTIAPNDSPMSLESTRILRAIEQAGGNVKASVQVTPPRANDGSMPQAAPRAGVQRAPVAPAAPTTR